MIRPADDGSEQDENHPNGPDRSTRPGPASSDRPTSQADDDLRARFLTGVVGLLVDQLRVPEPAAEAVGACLFARMADTSLAYHTPDHVLAIWAFYHDMPRSIRPPLAPIDQAAIWFHDAVYVPTASPGLSEQWSAAFAASLLAAWLPTPDIERLVSLILATACHAESGPIRPDGADLILDLDLSNLATPRFADVNLRLRREFHHLSESQWHDGRRAFLDRMLNRPTIYRTPLFRTHYEAAARANLEAARDAL